MFSNGDIMLLIITTALLYRGGANMALINCPECGKEISDKSEVCIHCGYPLKNSSGIYETINNKTYDVGFLLDDKICKIDKIEMVRNLSQCDLYTAKDIADKYSPSNQTIQPKTQSFVPKCPTCGSTNVEKISLTSKAVGGVMFGLFSSNVRKTMHCKNCGYKW